MLLKSNCQFCVKRACDQYYDVYSNSFGSLVSVSVKIIQWCAHRSNAVNCSIFSMIKLNVFLKRR